MVVSNTEKAVYAIVALIILAIVIFILYKKEDDKKSGFSSGLNAYNNDVSFMQTEGAPDRIGLVGEDSLGGSVKSLRYNAPPSFAIRSFH